MKGKNMKARDQLGGSMSDDTRIALLEQSIGHINQTLIRLEHKIDRFDEKIDSGFGKLDKKIIDLDKRISDEVRSLYASQMTQFRWIMGSILGVSATILTLFLTGQLG